MILVKNKSCRSLSHKVDWLVNATTDAVVTSRYFELRLAGEWKEGEDSFGHGVVEKWTSASKQIVEFNECLCSTVFLISTGTNQDSHNPTFHNRLTNS